jgi:tRNA_anti-like
MSDESTVVAAPRKKGCGFWLLVGLGIIVALAIIGSLLPEPSAEQKAEIAASKAADAKAEADKQAEEAKSKRDSAVKVSASQLFQAYDANEMAAQQQYGDKLLEVSGVVDGVDLDIGDDPVVKLRTSNQFMPVSVYLTEATAAAAAGFQKGQKITILCESISEVISMPQLKDCTPVE